MAAYTFLGEPPARIKQWIIDHATPPGPAPHADTRFTLQGGTIETHNITGTLDKQWLIDNGYYDGENYVWLKTITQADIGNTVTNIEGYMFEGCSSLTSVMILGGGTSIEEGAFFGCGLLESVMIGNGVTSIGDVAFSDCWSLTSVTIGSVESIGGSAFSCGLTSVTFNSFTKSQVKLMTTEDHIFGVAFNDPDTWEPIAKSFTAVCTDGSMTISFSAENPATITFTDL